MLDVTVNLCNKSLKKLTRLKHFLIIKIVSFFYIYLSSDSLNIAANFKNEQNFDKTVKTGKYEIKCKRGKYKLKTQHT